MDFSLRFTDRTRGFSSRFTDFTDRKEILVFVLQISQIGKRILVFVSQIT